MDFESYVKANDAILRNMQSQGTLPGNTVTNPKEDLKCITTRSGVAYPGPRTPSHSKQGTKSQAAVSEPVVAPVSAPMPNLKPSIPYPPGRDNEKRRDQANAQIKKFYEIFKDMSFEISFTDALTLMPKFASTLKALIRNKEKLNEMARTPMNEHCSAVILNKLPRKLGDPGKFLIPCEFPGMDECLALADLEGDNKLPVIIAKELGDEEKSALIKEDYKPVVQHQRRVNPKIHDVIKREVEKLLDAGLIYPISDSLWVSPVHCVPKKGSFIVVENEENELIPTHLVTGWRVCIDYRKLNEATRKDHFPFLFMDQMLERLARNEYYCFLDGFFRNSFETCLSRLDRMLQRCEDTNLSLNWEKNHFMVKEGIGHKISKNGIEVDRAKVDVIAKLPHPTTVKGIQSFLYHAGFYRRFIQDFSKISRPMTHLLEKNTPFVFSKDCIQAFQTLKKKLTEAPILITPNWDLSFELMCDASDFAISAVLGQRHEKHFKPIHYARVLKPSIPYPSRRDNEKRRDQANEQIEKYYEIFKDMSFEISFTDALTLMPKFASTLKALIGNKEKLNKMARTLMNEHYLGASINLMPFSVWETLSLLKLTPTCMTLELADRSVSKPISIAKDVSFKVGVFQFPADFVVVDFEPDPRVPLILGRCFLKTIRALIDVYKANKIDVIYEIYSQEVLGFSDITASSSPTPDDDPIVSTTSPTLTPFGDSDFLL
nr:retrovirus-related Pol polyprotein from transposon 17.6 [Tanacetum cinerariifolium]